MAEYYLKAEHHVTVQGAGDMRKMQDKLQDTRAEVRGYKDIIQEQAEELADLKKRVNDLEREKEERAALTEEEVKILKNLVNDQEIIKRLAKGEQHKNKIRRPVRTLPRTPLRYGDS